MVPLFTKLIQDAVDDVPLEGAAMLVVKDGEVLYEDYFGTYTADTIVGIASASKWFGAATVMALVDDGLIDLDDPVSKYLPAFSDEDKAEITIRQLLSHTSGLPEDCRCRWVGSMTLQDCCGEIAGLTMEAEPGVKFAYGGTSLQVAGGVAEVAGTIKADAPREFEILLNLVPSLMNQKVDAIGNRLRLRDRAA